MLHYFLVCSNKVNPLLDTTAARSENKMDSAVPSNSRNFIPVGTVKPGQCQLVTFLRGRWILLLVPYYRESMFGTSCAICPTDLLHSLSEVVNDWTTWQKPPMGIVLLLLLWTCSSCEDCNNPLWHFSPLFSTYTAQSVHKYIRELTKFCKNFAMRELSVIRRWHEYLIPNSLSYTTRSRKLSSTSSLARNFFPLEQQNLDETAEVPLRVADWAHFKPRLVCRIHSTTMEGGGLGGPRDLSHCACSDRPYLVAGTTDSRSK